MAKPLIILAGLAGVALVLPQLIIIGLFAGLLPGVVLAIAPTALLYTLIFAVVREVVPASRPAGGNAVAALVALALGVLSA
ncbi:MAG TPA: hypothetical protein VF636_08645, partial [Sphingomonas sp.]